MLNELSKIHHKNPIKERNQFQNIKKLIKTLTIQQKVKRNFVDFVLLLDL